jgi:hypothetical protein
MMWGPGTWAWGWIFPLIGLVMCVAFMAMMMRAMGRGHGFMCMGGHRQAGSDPLTEIQRELRELREEVKQLRASR